MPKMNWITQKEQRDFVEPTFSAGCKKAFDQAPARYLRGASEKSGETGHGGQVAAASTLF